MVKFKYKQATNLIGLSRMTVESSAELRSSAKSLLGAPKGPESPFRQLRRSEETYSVCSNVFPSNIVKNHLANIWKNLTLSEISGCLGDLGSLIPLLVPLAANEVQGSPQIDFAAALFYNGVFNFATSFYYSVPVAAQPMHTIASIALVEDTPRDQILAAGILMGALVLLMELTRVVHLVNRFVPLSVVRGVQLGVGMGLVMKALSNKFMFVQKPVSSTQAPSTQSSAAVSSKLANMSSSSNNTGERSAFDGNFTIGASSLSTLSSVALSDSKIVWFGWNSVSVALLGSILALLFYNSRRVPVALLLFFLGVVLAVCSHPSILSSLALGISLPPPVAPTLSDFKSAFFTLSLPQLPLTLLNSVIALSQMVQDLFPGHRPCISTTCYSVGCFNAICCWFGAVPTCHGCGGLASQFAFGARTNASMFFLGLSKITLAVVFGSSLLVLLDPSVFPSSVLGVLLLIAGIEMAIVARDVSGKDEAMAMVVTAGASLTTNTGVGFVLGLATAGLLRVSRWWTDNQENIEEDTSAEIEEAEARREGV